MRIVDCHAHFGRFAQTNVVCSDESSTLRAMDRAGVEKLCISSFLSIGPDCRAGNDEVARAVRAHSDRLAGYAAVNPNRPAEIKDELERCFSRQGFKAIKLHPAFHKHPIGSSSYSHVFAFAQKHRKPILSHEWGTPDFLAKLSSEYPDATFILAHTGFWDGRSDFPFAPVLRQRQNVFVDLVYSNIYYEALERMVEHVGADKILWGSDFPLHDIGYQLGRVAFSRLDDAAREKILGGTMLRILGEDRE